MKTLISLLVFFVSAACFADGLPISPNDIPLFYSFVGEDPKYHDAAYKAQEAFFIQSGVTPMYNKVSAMATDKATSTATYLIDKDTPLNSKDVFFVVGAAYTVGVKKHINKSFKNPLFPSVTNTVDVSQQQGSLGFKISF